MKDEGTYIKQRPKEWYRQQHILTFYRPTNGNNFKGNNIPGQAEIKLTDTLTNQMHT